MTGPAAGTSRTRPSRGDGRVRVRGVGDHALRELPDPFPPGTLFRGEVPLADVQLARVAHQTLLAGFEIEHPQAVHGVLCAVGAKEHHT